MYAKLIRGNTYYLGDKLFEAGKSVEITEKEHAILTDEELGAFDYITVEGEAQRHEKFEFSDEAPEAPVEAAPVRRRRPAQA